MVCQHERGAEDPQASGDLDPSTQGREEEEEEGSEIVGISRDFLPSRTRVSQRPNRSSLGTRSPPPPSSSCIELN